MKKVVIAFIFLMLIGGVFAMDGAIRVKTEAGNEVRLAVRLLDGGSLGYNENGIADEDGYWEHTFFSLNREDIKYHVRIISGKNILREDVFENWGTSDPLLVDCVSNPCVMSVDSRVVEEVEELPVILNESVDVENESVEEVLNESVEAVVIVDVESESVVENDSGDGFLSGMAVFTNEDGSIKWFYSVGGGVVFLFLIVFLFLFVRKPGKNGEGVVEEKGGVVVDDDEKELQEMESRVKVTEERIKVVKEGKERKVKIERAKAKLAEEEAELKELENEKKEKIEEQKEVVETAEDKVEDAMN